MDVLKGYAFVLIIVGIVVGGIAPFVFSVKFKREHGVIPVSWLGFVFQLAALFGLLVEYSSDTSNNLTLMIIITVASFLLAIILSVSKVSKAGASAGQKAGAAFTQLFFFGVILCILLAFLSRKPNQNHTVGPQGWMGNR